MSRTRSSSNSHETDYLYETHGTPIGHNASNNVVTSYEGTHTDETSELSMTDVVTPQFHKRVAAGEIINSPMVKTHTVEQISVHHQVAKSVWRQWDANCIPGGEWHYGLAMGIGHLPASMFMIDVGSDPIEPDEVNYDNLIDLAIQKAWARVSVTDIQSLVMVGEAHKTVFSLISIFKRFIKILKKIKRLDTLTNTFGTELTAKALSERYMEIRYALRPLMYDIVGTVAALQTSASDYQKRLTFRASGTDSDIYEDHSVIENRWTAHGGSYGFDNHKDSLTTVEFKVRAGVLTALEQLDTLNIWGITQPFESLWELVPFSFVIDWFFNVGDMIGAWTPNYGIKALTSWYTLEKVVHQRVDVNWHNDHCVGGDWVSYQRSISNCYYDKVIIEKSRVPNPSRWSLPTFKINLDALKLIDLLIIAKGIAYPGGYKNLRI